MAYHRNFDYWRKDPKKAARLYRFEEKLEEQREVEDRAVKKWIGNILTDRKWWSEEPKKAHGTMDEGFFRRLDLMLGGRRGVKPHPKKQKWFFDEFFDQENYHVAGLYADKAGIDTERDVEKRLYSLLEEPQDPDMTYEKRLGEAFSLLDSFNYGRTVDEFEERYETDYFNDEGPDLVIDQVASDLLSSLDGSAKAFFQMYIAPREDRPMESFRDETVAETYESRGRTPRRRDAYIEDGLEAFKNRFENNELEQAKYIANRFDLPASRLVELAHEHR